MSVATHNVTAAADTADAGGGVDTQPHRRTFSDHMLLSPKTGPSVYPPHEAATTCTGGGRLGGIGGGPTGNLFPLNAAVRPSSSLEEEESGPRADNVKSHRGSLGSVGTGNTPTATHGGGLSQPTPMTAAVVDAAAYGHRLYHAAAEATGEEDAALGTAPAAAASLSSTAVGPPPLQSTNLNTNTSAVSTLATTGGAAVIMLHKRVKTIEALARNRELYGYETIGELQALLRRAATAPDPCRVALGGDGARFIGRSPAAVDFLLEHGFIRETGIVPPAATAMIATGSNRLVAPAEGGWGSASPSPAAASPSPTMPRDGDEATDGGGAGNSGSVPTTPPTTTNAMAKAAAAPVTAAPVRVDYVYIPVVPLEDSVDWHVFRSEMLEALALLQWALTCNTSLITVRLHRLTFFGTHAVSSSSQHHHKSTATCNTNTPPSAALSPASASASPSTHPTNTTPATTTNNNNTVPFLEGGGDYRFEVTLLWRDELDCIREQTLHSEYFDLNDALAITDGTGIPAALAGGGNKAPSAAITVRPSPGVSPSAVAGGTLLASQTPHMHAVIFTRNMAVLPSSECDKACTITVAVRRRKPKGALAAFFSSSTNNSGTIKATSPPLPFSNTECARMAVDLRAPDKSGRCGLPIGRVAIEIDSLQLRFMDAENEILKLSQRAAAESASRRQRDAAIIAASSSSEARYLSASRRGSIAAVAPASVKPSVSAVSAHEGEATDSNTRSAESPAPSAPADVPDTNKASSPVDVNAMWVDQAAVREAAARARKAAAEETSQPQDDFDNWY